MLFFKKVLIVDENLERKWYAHLDCHFQWMQVLDACMGSFDENFKRKLYLKIVIHCPRGINQ